MNHLTGIILIIAGVALFPVVLICISFNILPQNLWNVCFFGIPITLMIIGSVIMQLFPEFYEPSKRSKM